MYKLVIIRVAVYKLSFYRHYTYSVILVMKYGERLHNAVIHLVFSNVFNINFV